MKDSPETFETVWIHHIYFVKIVNNNNSHFFQKKLICLLQASLSSLNFCFRHTTYRESIGRYQFLWKMTLFSMVFYGSGSIFINQNKFLKIIEIWQNLKFWGGLKSYEKTSKIKMSQNYLKFQYLITPDEKTNCIK